MNPTLPSLRELLAEAWLLAKPELGVTTRILLLKVLPPLVILVVLAVAVHGTDALLFGLIAILALVWIVTSLSALAQTIEVALASAEGREVHRRAPSGMIVFASLAASSLVAYAFAIPFEILKGVTGLATFSVIGAIVELVITIRLDLAPTIVVAEGGVVSSLKRSWRLTKSCWGRYLVYQLVIALPIVVLGVLIFLVLLTPAASTASVWQEGIGPNAAEVVFAIVIAIVPYIALRYCYLTFFDAVIYLSLRDSEQESREGELMHAGSM